MEQLHSKLRKEDEYLSNHVSDILNEVFYNDATLNITDFKRIYGKKTQVKGIDTTFKYNGEEYKCDEKSAVRYKNLKTFALELSFKNRQNRLSTGWFLNDALDTDSYLFTWLNEYKTRKDNEQTPIIQKEMEVVLVRKEKIYNYLSQNLGWTKEKLKKKNDKIRNSEDNNLGDINLNGSKFSFSRHLVEQPINILLPKTTYIKLADIYKKYKLDEK